MHEPEGISPARSIVRSDHPRLMGRLSRCIPPSYSRIKPPRLLRCRSGRSPACLLGIGKGPQLFVYPGVTIVHDDLNPKQGDRVLEVHDSQSTMSCGTYHVEISLSPVQCPQILVSSNRPPSSPSITPQDTCLPSHIICPLLIPSIRQRMATILVPSPLEQVLAL